MTFSLRREAPALAILLAMFVATAWVWPHAPDTVATHWGVDGQPDAWGSKATGLLMLPGVALGTWAFMLILPRFDPGRANYATFGGVYTAIRSVLIAFFAVMHGGALAAALGHEVDMGRIAAPAAGLMLLLLGGMIGKVRPNWFVGIRTPWTLTSKRAWTRTHRVGGWAFVLHGAVVFVAGLVSPPVAYAALFVGSLGIVAFVFAYSYLVWKNDPDRQSPGGTTPA